MCVRDPLWSPAEGIFCILGSSGGDWQEAARQDLGSFSSQHSMGPCLSLPWMLRMTRRELMAAVPDKQSIFQARHCPAKTQSVEKRGKNPKESKCWSVWTFNWRWLGLLRAQLTFGAREGHSWCCFCHHISRRVLAVSQIPLLFHRTDGKHGHFQCLQSEGQPGEWGGGDRETFYIPAPNRVRQFTQFINVFNAGFDLILLCASKMVSG